MPGGPYLWFLGHDALDGQVPVFNSATGRFEPASGGAIALSQRQITASDNVLGTDQVLLVDSTLAPITLTLLAAASFTGRRLWVVHTDPNNDLTLQPQVGETIIRESNVQLAGDAVIRALTLYSDGTEYWIL